MEGMTVQLVQKAGVDGRLFGSVTNHDIAEALGKQGFTVPKAAMRMPNGPLKAVGDHAVEVSLATDVTVSITVSVLGEHV
jgi:large subunit ribosomal protein L9